MSDINDSNLMYWEDFPVGFSAEFGDYLIAEEEIVGFAEKYDPQYFHIDKEKASESLFGALCASGWNTTAILSRMFCEEFILRSACLGSPGVEHIAWPKPTFCDDRVRMKLKVLSSRPLKSKPGVGIVRFNLKMINHNDEEVLDLIANIMFRQRSALLQT
jgi:acyl dehydratase